MADLPPSPASPLYFTSFSFPYHEDNDPDNILGPHGTVGRVTEGQARTQMTLWSMFPTQLILGEDVTKMSDEYVATVGNEELIAINQDAPWVSGARRIVGDDLSYPCKQGSGAACTNVWARSLAGGDVALAFVNHGTNATEVVCDSDCFAAIGLSDAKSLAVRDMWAHADLPTRRPPYSFTVNVTGDGSAEAFRLSRVM